LYLSASAEAIDAALMTKGTIVTDFSTTQNIPLTKIGAIGDAANDLPFLSLPHLGLRGVTANAQTKVKDKIIDLSNSMITSKEGLEGFEEFYEQCQKRNIQYIFSDRDGVLIWSNTDAVINRLHDMLISMDGTIHPYIKILTGSSYEQNTDFIEKYRIRSILKHNPSLNDDPYLILAENGAIQINIFSLEVRDFKNFIDEGLVQWLKEEFEPTLCRTIEKKVFPRFGLSWSANILDQVEKVYIPPKRTMVTLDVPKVFKSGEDYRKSKIGENLRMAILGAMEEIANNQNVPYKIL